MTYAELQRKIKTASAWYLGAFMSEFIDHYYEYCDDKDAKKNFIDYMFKEYDGCNSYESVRSKCYAIIEIIEANKVVDALEYVIASNDKTVIEQAKINAQELLDDIKSRKVELPYAEL